MDPQVILKIIIGLIRTWDIVVTHGPWNAQLRTVAKVWSFGYAQDENNEIRRHPQSNGIGGGEGLPDNLKSIEQVVFGTVSQNLSVEDDPAEQDEQRERMQDNNNVHEALIENGWIPRQMPRQPWTPQTTHYIHNSFVGLDGQEKPDEYWQHPEDN